MMRISRREFLKTGAATGALAGAGALPVFAERGSATDWVTLGKSGVKVTRLALGTGTNSGRVQQQLGQEGFTRLVRHAYDNGIRFFETSESYGASQQMLGKALKGIPRDSYRLMTKVTTTPGIDMRVKLDELRRNSDTEYFDIMLLHCQQVGSWPEDNAQWEDAVLEAQQRKTVLTHGASVHGLPALRRVPGNKWLDVAMIRMNHKGTRMDNENDSWDVSGNVSEVVNHVHQAHSAGMGVISMKLVGEGAFNRSDRQQAVRFAFRNAGVDSVTIGYKSTDEIDEAIENVNMALA
jgi:aryl-alcohol dehydrogenase-like predicted oxidoreductase